MGRERKAKSQLSHAGKERRRRDARPILKKAHNTAGVQPPQHLKALKDAQKYKYTSRFEWVENKDKKDKRINLIKSTSITPPVGYTFIPVGNPSLTKSCKETSRTQDAPVYIVTLANRDKPRDTPTLEDDDDESMLEQLKDYKNQMTRLGYHVREHVVDQVKEADGIDDISATFPWVTIQQNRAGDIIPEPIPKNQSAIYCQADQVICDLFPRIPNTDRAQLILHAFDKSAPTFRGEKKVGLAADIVLSRRCALAVLAHIRHTHTRYDDLLKESNYIQARKAVQGPCLDILVKWRGDEETGRDTASEVLRELVVIDDDSETEFETSDEEYQDASDYSETAQGVTPSPQLSTGEDATPVPLVSPPDRTRSVVPSYFRHQSQHIQQHATESGHIRKTSRNFRRYEQLGRKYGAEEARSRAYRERLLESPVRAGSLCTPPLPRTSTEMIVIRDIPGADKDPTSHGYYQHAASTSIQASAFPVAADYSRHVEMGVRQNFDSMPLRPIQHPHRDPCINGQQEERSGGDHQPSLVHERVRVQEQRSSPRTLLSRLHLEDMLMPSVEPVSPGAYAAHQTTGIDNDRQFESRQDIAPQASYPAYMQDQSLGMEYRPADDRHGHAYSSRRIAEPYHGQSSISLSEARLRAHPNDAHLDPLHHPYDRVSYPTGAVPTPRVLGRGQSALDTMGFIQIRRHEHQSPHFALRGQQRHLQHVYPPSPRIPTLSTHQPPSIQPHRDETAHPIIIHRVPAAHALQQSDIPRPQAGEEVPWYSTRAAVDDGAYFMNRNEDSHGNLSARGSTVARPHESHHLPRPHQVVIID